MPKTDSIVHGGPKLGNLYLHYGGKCPCSPLGCRGEMTKVFEFPQGGGVSLWFTACEKHEKGYLKDVEKGTFKLAYPYEEAKKYVIGAYPDFVVLPEGSAIRREGKLAPKLELGLNPGLYHLIYQYGPKSRHFVTYADSEKEAKEKIIEKHRHNFDQGFEKDILELSANIVKNGVLMVYGN